MGAAIVKQGAHPRAGPSFQGDLTPEVLIAALELPTQAKSGLEWATCDLSGSFPAEMWGQTGSLQHGPRF